MFTTLYEQLVSLSEIILFQIGTTAVTVWMLLYLVVLTVLFIFITKQVQHWVVHRWLPRTGMNLGDRESTGTIIRYLMLVIGFIIVLQTTGIDLTILNVLAGSLGIGVGFGLQNIVNNFVSGLIILIEKPIKVGDRIEIANVHGKVIKIGARSATVLTNDNIAIIVPNQKFINENIINWSHSDDQRRFIIPIVVALDSDPYLVERLLLEAAREDPDVLDDPPPGVRLFGFGAEGMDFELRAWSHALIHRRGYLTSKLNFAILDKFRSNNVEFVIPQKEVFLRNEPPGQKS
jgi:small-conductance mechanosensitive channel